MAKKTTRGFECSPSRWNGGRGYRCRSPYTGTYVKQSKCRSCPVTYRGGKAPKRRYTRA